MGLFSIKCAFTDVQVAYAMGNRHTLKLSKRLTFKLCAGNYLDGLFPLQSVGISGCLYMAFDAATNCFYPQLLSLIIFNALNSTRPHLKPHERTLRQRASNKLLCYHFDNIGAFILFTWFIYVHNFDMLRSWFAEFSSEID